MNILHSTFDYRGQVRTSKKGATMMTEIKKHDSDCNCDGKCGDNCKCQTTVDASVCPARIAENQGYPIIINKEADMECSASGGDPE